MLYSSCFILSCFKKSKDSLNILFVIIILDNCMIEKLGAIELLRNTTQHHKQF